MVVGDGSCVGVCCSAAEQGRKCCRCYSSIICSGYNREVVIWEK